MSSYLLERDLLYTTDNLLDPGCFHVKILNPNNSKMPVIIESKSGHSLVEYIGTIIDVLQNDTFDRIRLKIIDCTVLYILPVDLDRQKYPDAKFIKVIFMGENEYLFEPVHDEIF